MLNRTGRSPAKGSSRSRGTQGSLFPWAMPRLDWWVPDAVAGDCVAELPVLPVGSTFTPRHRSISATNHGPETRVAVSPKGQPEKILSVHSFQDRAAKWINKISHSTGPYSPDQGGPPDKTSGVEASWTSSRSSAGNAPRPAKHLGARASKRDVADRRSTPRRFRSSLVGSGGG